MASRTPVTAGDNGYSLVKEQFTPLAKPFEAGRSLRVRGGVSVAGSRDQRPLQVD